jgi:predicted PurR-regulated permease PerM
MPRIGSWIFGQVTKAASWFGVLAGLALIPVYTFYLLLEKRGIEQKWTDYLPVAKSGFKDELVFVLKSINDYLIVFFRGQVLVALCDGILYTIGFFIIGLPYAFVIGAMATVLTMIPFLGAIVTCVAALIIAFVQFGDWLHPGLVLAVFAVVQALEGLVISPKIMGDRVGLHPLTIIIAVMIGTTVLGGLLGGILAIPLTAALRVVMFRYVWKRRGPGSDRTATEAVSPEGAAKVP